jgi:hypothetical protein
VARPLPVVFLTDGPADEATVRRWSGQPPGPHLRLVAVRADAVGRGHPVGGAYALVASARAAAAAYRLIGGQPQRHPVLALFLLGQPIGVPAAQPLGGVPIVVVRGTRDAAAPTPPGPRCAPGQVSVRVRGDVVDPLDLALPDLVDVLVNELGLWQTVTLPGRASRPDRAALVRVRDWPADAWSTGDGPPSARAQVAEMARVLTLIPDSARRFSVPAARIAADYGLSPALLEVALAAGLPRLVHDGSTLFDDVDLLNLALCPGLRTPQRVVLRSWRQVLRRPRGEEQNYEISYRAGCPVPGHPGVCRYEVRLPDDRVATVDAGTSGRQPLWRAQVRLRDDWPDLPARVEALVAELKGVRFMRMPNGIRWEAPHVRKYGFGDCTGICDLAVEEGRRRGIPMRGVFGLIVASPYSAPHHWPETLVEDRWVPCDPGLLDALERWGVLSAGEWPVGRSLGPVLLPVSTTRPGGAVTHGPFSAACSFPTRAIVAGSAGASAHS